MVNEWRRARNVWITSHVCEVDRRHHERWQVKFCSEGDDRCATFTRAGVLWHEVGEEVKVDRTQNPYELECWVKPGGMVAPVSVGGSCRGAAHLVSQRTGAVILRDVQPEGASATRAGEDHIEPRSHTCCDIAGTTGTQQTRDRETQSLS